MTPETKKTLPEEYAINGFDMAVRGLAGCRCDFSPCDHVKVYIAAREQLLNATVSLRTRLRNLEEKEWADD